MNEPWKRICAGCRHINAQEPNQHCYMFKDEPNGKCMQHTELMDGAQREGKVVTKAQLSEIVRSEL